MELLFLDERLMTFDLIDAFESLIWTERFWEAGDFELYTAMDGQVSNTISLLREYIKANKDIYVWMKDSDSIMMVETVKVEYDDDEKLQATISGRSLEFILDRRIIWKETLIDSYLEYAIERLLNENIITPEQEERQIPNFVYESSEDPEIEKMRIRKQFSGDDNLYDAICSICKDFQIGFKITLNDKKQFVFKLFSGSDRSYDQVKNPRVIFSPSYGNLANDRFLVSVSTLKTTFLIAGEDTKLGDGRKTLVLGDEESGLKRREYFVDARDLQSEKEDGSTMNDEDYYEGLKQRGEKNKEENQLTKTFECEINNNTNFVYGIDFFKGDVVQIDTEYGIEEKGIILEIVHSYDSSGYSVYPTLELL